MEAIRPDEGPALKAGGGEQPLTTAARRCPFESHGFRFGEIH